MTLDDRRSDDFVILRCSTCGDTFPAHDLDAAVCPCCGGRSLEPAREPLL